MTHFVFLINTIPRIHRNIFHRIWHQLYEVLSDKEVNSQGSFATSQQLQCLALKGLTSLLLRVGYHSISENKNKKKKNNKKNNKNKNLINHNYITIHHRQSSDRSRELGLISLRELFPVGQLNLKELLEVMNSHLSVNQFSTNYYNSIINMERN